MQETLCREIAASEIQEPTYDQLMNTFPYLDAVTCEILRLHPPLPEIAREVSFSFRTLLRLTSLFPISKAQEDDLIPLSHPIRTASGELVDSIFVARGTQLVIPVAGVNRSDALWGEDAHKFDPSRWLGSGAEEATAEDGASKEPAAVTMGRAAEVHGYRHLLTFANGPRTCLGRNFALVELKVRCLPSIFSRLTCSPPPSPSLSICGSRL